MPFSFPDNKKGMFTRRESLMIRMVGKSTVFDEPTCSIQTFNDVQRRVTVTIGYVHARKKICLNISENNLVFAS